jgi:hypothetical protein
MGMRKERREGASKISKRCRFPVRGLQCSADIRACLLADSSAAVAIRYEKETQE